MKKISIVFVLLIVCKSFELSASFCNCCDDDVVSKKPRNSSSLGSVNSEKDRNGNKLVVATANFRARSIERNNTEDN